MAGSSSAIIAAATSCGSRTDRAILPGHMAKPKLLPQCDPTLRNKLAREHWPEGIAFTQEQNVLMGRGWPQLRVLVDGDKRDKKPAALADKVYKAIDPVIPIYWPREAAKHFICKYAELEAPMEITVDVVDAVIEETVGTLGYSFKPTDALLLAECFLGSEVIADRIVSRLERFKKAEWASDNPHDTSIILISLLEPLLLRIPLKPALALSARLRKLAPATKKGLPAIRLRWLLASHLPAVEAEFLYNVPIQTSDRAGLRKYLEHQYSDWLLSPQHLFIAGPDIVDDKRHIAKLRRMPGWRQKWFCEAFGIIRHPVIAKMMKALEGSRGAGGLPEAWLAEHGSGKKPKPVKQTFLSKREVDAGVKKLFDKLVADVEAVRGKPAKEKPIWIKAVHDLIELRAAGGDPTPEFHIGHILAVDGWGKLLPPLETLEPEGDENDRWLDMIDAGMS
jgi:hypothetical protein